jgi:hypothetical protein
VTLLILVGLFFFYRIWKYQSEGESDLALSGLRVEVMDIEVSLESVFYKDVFLKISNDGSFPVRPGKLRLSWPEGEEIFDAGSEKLAGGDSKTMRVRLTFKSGNVNLLTRESLSVQLITVDGKDGERD